MAADEVVETPFGKFLVNPDDVIGATTKAGTLWDGPGFLQPIALEHGRLGEAGTTILDVGANIGTYSVWLARHGAWRVVAVEPVPPTIRYLQANLDLNREPCADRVVHLPIAAYDKRAALVPIVDMTSLGATPLVLDGTELSTLGVLGSPETDICATPLDEYRWLFGECVSYIKIDAQGCDAAVLHGLKQTIAEDQPVVVFEWEEILSRPHGYTLLDTISWLKAQGYEVHSWPTHPNNYLCRPTKG